MKRQNKRLSLAKESLKALNQSELSQAQGGRYSEIEGAICGPTYCCASDKWESCPYYLAYAYNMAFVAFKR